MTEPPASIADCPRPPFPLPFQRRPESDKLPSAHAFSGPPNLLSSLPRPHGQRRQSPVVRKWDGGARSVAFSPSHSIRRTQSWHSILAHPQRMNAEQAVGPGLERRPAAAPGHRLERLDRIFVAVLGMDGFAGAEFDRRVADPHFLPFGAGKVHFDAMTFGVVEGVVLEGGEI